MSLQASAAVGRWWCSPEAVARLTPLPGREPATVGTTAPSRSRLPPCRRSQISGKRAWPPQRLRRPLTAAETSVRVPAVVPPRVLGRLAGRLEADNRFAARQG